MLGTSAPAEAQTVPISQRMSLSPEVGLVVPAGEFGEFFETGMAAGLRVSYELGERTTLFAAGGLDRLRGRELYAGTRVRSPNTRILHYGAGLDVELFEPDLAPWSFRTQFGIGAMTFRSDDFQAPGSSSTTSFDRTSFAANVGAQVGYSFGRVTLFGGGQLHWSPINRDEFVRSLAVGPLPPFKSATTIRPHLGIKASP